MRSWFRITIAKTHETNVNTFKLRIAYENFDGCLDGRRDGPQDGCPVRMAVRLYLACCKSRPPPTHPPLGNNNCNKNKMLIKRSTLWASLPLAGPLEGRLSQLWRQLALRSWAGFTHSAKVEPRAGPRDRSDFPERDCL